MRKGAVVWLTGMSGAGKSTIARALVARMQTDDIRLAVHPDR
ncbi:adenylyl-sulfate kinase [Paraburkholderia sp. EG287A]